MNVEHLRLKYLTSRPSGDACASSADDFISLDGVESWTGKRLPIDGGERDLCGTPCRSGDLLFGKLRPYLAKVHLVETDSVCASEFIAMRPRKDVEPRFLRYALSTEDFVKLVNSMSYGTKMPRVDPSDFLDIKLKIPHRLLQARIADHLDSETAHIETLIDRKQRFIDLLLEKRDALITQAVMSGLDQAVTMTESGLDWLGQVPAHWHRLRLKHVLRERTVLAEDGHLNELLSVFASVGVRPRAEMPDVGNKAVTTEGYKWVEPGDLVVNKMLTWMGALGLSEYRGVTSPAYCVYQVAPSASGRYLHFLLRTKLYQSEFRRRATGIMPMRWTVVPSVFLDTPVFLPPLAEQLATLDHVRTMTSDLERLVEKTRLSINLLREYRAALITATVTGRVTIPGAEASEDVA